MPIGLTANVRGKMRKAVTSAQTDFYDRRRWSAFTPGASTHLRRESGHELCELVGGTSLAGHGPEFDARPSSQAGRSAGPGQALIEVRAQQAQLFGAEC